MNRETDTLRRVQERTAARKLLGLIPDYSQHAPRTSRHIPTSGVVDCVHMRGPTQELVECEKCRNKKTSLRLFSCDKFSRCTTVTQVPGVPCCATCTSREPHPRPQPETAVAADTELRWACGVTTVPSRWGTTLPKTLASISDGGFKSPRLFVDGEKDALSWGYLGFDYTLRWPAVHAFGNFWLGLLEMYLRDPLADLYAMFQDDILVCRNTKQYMEASIRNLCAELSHPPYFNLFTSRPNEDLVKHRGVGWHPSNQLGWGGQALVFPRDTLQRMFQSKHFVERPLGMRNGVPDPPRAWRNLDGGVAASVKSFGGVELVHNPSLVFHMESPSSMGNTMDGRMAQGRWPGEDFDATRLLGIGSNTKWEAAVRGVETATV